MINRRYLYQWIAVVAFIAFSSTFLIYANGNKEKQGKNKKRNTRTDIISINTLKSFGPLERNEVFFLHDAHTDALKKINKNCEACHQIKESTGKGTLSLKFKRLEEENKQQVMDTYHTNCISCHKEMSNEGKKTGPTELCGECHKETPADTSAGQPMEFDKYLHASHMKLKEDCSSCHHDNQKEGSCRECHKNDGSNKLISLRTASHLSCIGCHKDSSGPTKCNSCHNIDEQQKIKRSGDVPRLMRGQPDVILIGADSQDKDTGKFTAKLNPVPFDHKAHEQYQDTCRICHHKKTESCSRTCHTREGAEKGDMVRDEQAMHNLGSNRSCLGCHEIIKNQKECAGCHGLMAKGSSLDDTCVKCHMGMLKTGVSKNQKPESIAAMLLESRKTVIDIIDEKDIPEIVTINDLSSQYGSVELPHRQIISALINDIEDNKLANYFHSEKGTICQACHHNSPVTMTPPACSSCHGKPFDELNPFRPGLKAAYHQQCMDCHDNMNIKQPESTDCVACHKVTGTNKLYDF